jgi:hypothetical protein
MPHKVLVMQITSFLPSVEELALFLCERGAEILGWVRWGVLGLCTLWGSRYPGTCRVANYHFCPLSGGAIIPSL